jgi:PAS domain S-box-containing protein
MKASVEKQIGLGFIASVLALLGISWLSYHTIESSIQAQAWVTHTYEVISTLEQCRATLTEAEAEQRGYLLTSNESFFEDSQKAQAQVNSWFARVVQLTPDNLEQQKRLEALRPIITQRLALLNNRMELRREKGLQAAVDAVSTRQGADLQQQIFQRIDEMQAAENQLLQARQQAQRVDTRIAESLVVSGGLLASVLGLIAFLMTRRDLRLREQTRLELQENRARLQSILDNMPANIFLKDLEGRYLFVNRQFLKINGLPAEKVIGKTIYDIAPREHAEIAHGHHQKVLATQSTMEVEETIMYPDGPHTHLAVKFPIRDTAGKIFASGGISTDITERKRMSALLERERHLMNQIMDNATEDVYFKDRESRFIRINRHLAQRFGLDDPAKAVGTTDADFFSEEHSRQARKDEEEILRTGEPMAKEEQETWPDGHVTWVLTVKSPLRDPAGNVVGTFGLSRDITEQKVHEQEVKKLSEELQRRAVALESANKELEAFSYSVSHDLRAPLRHIDGFVKMLDKSASATLDDRGKRYLEIIADSARRMGALIDDLLVFSRMGRTELRHTRVDSNALIHEVLDSLQPDLQGRNIDWKIAHLPQVQADLAMLRQVWANLIANAVKYSRPRDPARIEIGCNQDNGEFVFCVRDNGVGFDMQYAHKLFGVFQRLHRTEEFEGTGIGLANVQRIVLRHHGRVWAEGGLNEGAAFFFAIPKRRVDIKDNLEIKG